jgi:hypothetical protein
MTSAAQWRNNSTMQRTFYFLIVGSIALIWLGHRMRLALAKLMTGHPGDHALDMRFFGYSTEAVKLYLERLGAEKRKFYLQTQTRVELGFIVAYGIAGAAGGVWLSSLIYSQNWKLVSWVPFVGGLLVASAAIVDIDEAQAIRKLLKSWPKIDDASVERASRATRLKWLLLFAGVALVLAGATLAVIAKLKSM